MYRDYIANGIPAFPLWGIDKNGDCECDYEKCEAAGKHPRISRWQHTPLYSDEQLEFMEETNQWDNGWGAVVAGGLLVVDVDARNGGVESYAKLLKEVPALDLAGLIVETGSGQGSKHVYFKIPDASVSLLQHHGFYPGIDFKSSGYVVGPGSTHKSGGVYKIISGDPARIDDAPAALLELLKRPEHYRGSVEGKTVDLSAPEIAEMLAAIDPDSTYQVWNRCGMAIHEITGGADAGLELWDAWSKEGKKYPGPAKLEHHWHSFGKNAQPPVGAGTLASYAIKAGWTRSVTFVAGAQWIDDTPKNEDAEDIDTEGVDLLRPPGFVGEICSWINARSRYPREHLAVAAALYVISSVTGMRFRDPHDEIMPNVFMFGVAGSSTGKESILQSVLQILHAVGLSSAVHGGFKSEQEIFRNLLQHQAALYSVDEMGEQLAKLENARNGGGPAYLQAIIGTVMSAFTKAGGIMPVTGDLKRSLGSERAAEYKSLLDKYGENPDNPADKAKLERAKDALKSASQGIKNPFLNIFGLTTPGVFDELMTFDMAANGFVSRAMIFRERDDNPRRRPRSHVRPKCVPDNIVMVLSALYSGGETTDEYCVRKYGEFEYIETNEDALDMLDLSYESFQAQAERHVARTGLTPIPRRGYEMVCKISMLLAIPSGLRTTEHVRWAHALVKNDIEGKLLLVHANTAPDQEAILSKVISHIGDEGETAGVIRNRCKKWTPENVNSALAHLVGTGRLREEEIQASRAPGGVSKRYFITK